MSDFAIIVIVAIVATVKIASMYFGCYQPKKNDEE